MHNEEQEIDLNEVFNLLRKTLVSRWKLILFPSVLALMLSYCIFRFINFLEEPKYVTNSVLKIGSEMGQPLESIIVTQKIMYSQPILIKIGKYVGSKMTQNDLNAIAKSLELNLEGETLRITVTTDSPIDSFRINFIATELIYNRHMKLYNNAESNLISLVSFVRNNVRPAPLFTSIREFKIEPTTIEVYPAINPNPLQKKDSKGFIIIFIVSIIVMSTISFYLESVRKENK